MENENRNCGYNCGCGCPMNNNDNMIIDNGYQNSVAMPASFGMKTSTCCGQPCSSPNIATYSYNFTNIMPEESPCEQQITREEMLQQIQCLKFAVVEIAEYLDTHPDDRKAICLHQEYANKLHDLKEKYEKVFGPLSIYFPCNSWRWIEGPWPWEGGNF